MNKLIKNKMKSETLIQELTELTEQNMGDVLAFKGLSDEELNAKTSAESWSILECIEHINRYGDFYIPEIKKRMEESNHKQSSIFRSGLLGDFFAKSMYPKEKAIKMKTFKSMNPVNSSLDRSVLDKSADQQRMILGLLQKAKNTDLTRVKTAISITKCIKLRLGDTFRVVIYHNFRHITQAKKMVT